MIINLKDTTFYFLTHKNPMRRNHILEEFKDYKLIEINPLVYQSKFKSGCSGFLKIIDKALQEQDRTKPFKPFIIIEDDVSFFHKRETIETPNDTDILYIGISAWGSNEIANTSKLCSFRINDEISRIYNMLSTHGLMICSAVGANILQKCIMEAYYKDNFYDLPLSKIQPFYNIYCLNKPLVFQDAIYGGHEEHTKITLDTNDNYMPVEYINKTNISVLTCERRVDRDLNLYYT
jgi:hypothetical protein